MQHSIKQRQVGFGKCNNGKWEQNKINNNKQTKENTIIFCTIFFSNKNFLSQQSFIYSSTSIYFVLCLARHCNAFSKKKRQITCINNNHFNYTLLYVLIIIYIFYFSYKVNVFAHLHIYYLHIYTTICLYLNYHSIVHIHTKHKTILFLLATDVYRHFFVKRGGCVSTRINSSVSYLYIEVNVNNAGF